MFLIRRPSKSFVQRTVDLQRDQPLMYPEEGLTLHSKSPAGFSENYYEATIGSGPQDFEKAKRALDGFQMLRLGWLDVVSAPNEIADGELVATLIKQFGIYSLNVARIVYTENEPASRYGFGYGTLPEYPVYGEERFSILFDDATGDVSFEIFSFARPATILSRIGWRFIRKAQKRFGPASCDALRKALRKAL